jgi:NitT/TauT family transport system substrate-binding protein
MFKRTVRLILLGTVLPMLILWITDMTQVYARHVGANDRVAAPVAQQSRLRLGTSREQGSSGVRYAEEQGWFTEAELSVEVQSMAGFADAVLAVLGGSLDAGVTNPVMHLWLRDQGPDLRAIAADADEERANPVHAILVPSNSPIQSAHDLEGKRLGINGSNSSDRVMVQAWLESHDVDASRVTLIELPEAVHWRALLDGRVDAVSAAEPLVTAAVAEGARVLANHYTEMNASTVLSYYVATGDWLSRNADVARRFAHAVHRANAALEANPDLRRQAAQDRLGITADLAARMHQPTLQTRIDPAAIQWWADAGQKMGYLQRAHNAQDMLFDSAR